MSLLGTLNLIPNPEHNPTARNRRGDESPDIHDLITTIEPPPNNWRRNSDWSTDETTLHRSSHYGGYTSGDVTDREDMAERRVTRLAQQLARQSTLFSMADNLENPFISTKEESTLNPHSPNFRSRDWMKNLLALTSRDPERYPQRAAGMSFRNLSVHGFGSPTDYQKDVFNSILQAGHLFRLAAGTAKQKIQILRDFDGLVKSGEMLVVLGRPGRYAAFRL